jgi:tripartite-type tricarboxylate transporter receptor subunit TctC
MNRRDFLCSAAAASFGVPALAQGTGPVRIVVAYPPGGPNDLIARALANAIAQPLGRTVLVENRAGATGTIGSASVARAAPDGQTLLLQNNSLLTAPVLMRQPPYDSLRDFTPITQVVGMPVVLVTSPASGITRVEQLVDMARKRPGMLNFGSSGPGGGPHLVAEMFKSATGIDVVHVPYKGAAPVIADLMAGQVQFLFGDVAAFMGQIRGGKLVPLAIVGNGRSAALPQVPTLVESGIRGVDAESWYGLFGPAKMAPEQVARIHAAVAEVLKRTEFADQLKSLGAYPVGSSPAEFDTFVRSEASKWAVVVRQSGAQIE